MSKLILINISYKWSHRESDIHVGYQVVLKTRIGKQGGGTVQMAAVIQVTFLMYAAMSFSMLYFSMACVAQSTASCCMSSDMSAFLITAFLSVIMLEGGEYYISYIIRIHIPPIHTHTHQEETKGQLDWLFHGHGLSPTPITALRGCIS